MSWDALRKFPGCRLTVTKACWLELGMLWHCQNILCPTCEVRAVPTIWLANRQAYSENCMRFDDRVRITKEMHITRGGLVRITLFKLWLVFFISFFDFGILGIGMWENTSYIFQMRCKDASDPLGERIFHWNQNKFSSGSLVLDSCTISKAWCHLHSL